jgi:hypothetical protein
LKNFVGGLSSDGDSTRPCSTGAQPNTYGSRQLALRASVGSNEAAKDVVARFGRIDEWH